MKTKLLRLGTSATVPTAFKASMGPSGAPATAETASWWPSNASTLAGSSLRAAAGNPRRWCPLRSPSRPPPPPLRHHRRKARAAAPAAVACGVRRPGRHRRRASLRRLQFRQCPPRKAQGSRHRPDPGHGTTASGAMGRWGGGR